MTASAPAIGLPALLDFAQSTNVLAGPLSFSVPNAVVYTNMAAHNPEFSKRLIKDIYVERDCSLAEIALVRLPNGATVLGAGHFALKVDNELVLEQYPPYFPKTVGHVDDLLNGRFPVEDICDEALLVARYGIFTWGHWLGELLPKAVLAEAAYPARFKFVLPYQVLAVHSPNLPWCRIRESLKAYGIDDDRIISIRSDHDYRFAKLYAVTPIWSDHLMHPAATQLMRTAIQIPLLAESPNRLAISRLPTYGRGLHNYVEIENILRASGFSVRITGAMPFLQQVAMFSQISLLFGVLGSDITNLIYSPSGVKVITVAPANFGDRFFYALVVERTGQQIDLRGPITNPNDNVPHKSTFRIEPAEVALAIGMFTGQVSPLQ